MLTGGHPAFIVPGAAMSHRLLTALLAAAAFAVAIPATALAQEDEPEEAGQAATKKDPGDRFCIRETGSRITATRNRGRKSDEECVNAAGRVYTREEIESTGSADVRDALRRLDPSIY
jgi:outer membrane receptor protein involved in Fe transport